MYAIVETGGKQLKVAAGDVVYVERLVAEPGERVTLDRVLLVAGEDGVQVGRPYVKGTSVVAQVEGQAKGPKIMGFKYKPKENYRKRYGHRQPYTRLRIEGIEAAPAAD